LGAAKGIYQQVVVKTFFLRAQVIIGVLGSVCGKINFCRGCLVEFELCVV